MLSGETLGEGLAAHDPLIVFPAAFSMTTPEKGEPSCLSETRGMEWNAMFLLSSFPRRLGRFLVMGAFAVVMGGCGPSAYTDVDLTHDLDADAQTTPEQAALIASLADSTTETLTYRIGSGDVLEIVFFTHPEQNRFVTVRPDGRITLPYVGELVASGKEPARLSAEIEIDYSSVLVDPKVNILLNKIGGRFYVLGEVREAGEFPYERPLTLLQAIAKAGGYNEDARLTNFVLIRNDEKGGRFAAVFDFREYMLTQEKVGDIYVQPDDIVWIPKDNISRWNNTARKALTGVLQAEDVIIRGMGIADFKNVYGRSYVRP